MKIFLDENITPSAKQIFEGFGYDVQSVQSYGLNGQDDNTILAVAIREQRILITQNGKDFILQIPPQLLNVNHYGLIWIRFHVTRRNIQDLCFKIHSFLQKEININNSIWKVTRNGGTITFNRRYPKPTKHVVCN